MLLRGRHVGLPVGEATGGFVSRPHALRGRIAQRQSSVDLLPALPQMTSHLPKSPEGPGEPLSDLAFPLLNRPRKRRSQVVVIRFRSIEPGSDVPPGVLRGGFLGPRQVFASVPLPDLLFLPTGSQTFEGVFTNRLEHEKSRLGRRLDAPHETLVPEGRDAVEHLDAEAGPADCLRLLYGKPAHEHSEAGEQAPVLVIEQVMAPFDGVSESALSFGQVAGATGEQTEPRSQPISNPFDRQEANTGGGELDCQRKPVEAGDDVRHQRSASRVQGEIGPCCPGPVYEQRHRFGSHQRLRRQQFVRRR